MDKLLTDNDRKEQLSMAYLAALCAHCGYTWSSPKLDRNSVDLTVHSRTSRFASLSFQLKATAKPKWSTEGLNFQLTAKNFNELVVQTQSPRLLAVMVLPDDDTQWLQADDVQLVMRRCVWWQTLRGRTPTEQGTVQVTLPSANLLTLDALRSLIRRSEENTL
jgi:hypothetical protein